MSKFVGIISTIAIIVISLPNISYANNQMSVPVYGQRWSPWAPHPLGDNPPNTSITIYNFGCAITSAAMVLNYYGVNTNPDDINIWLRCNEGYDYDPYTGYNDLIKWGVAAERDPGTTVGWVGSFNTDLTRLNTEVDNGYPVIAEVRLFGNQHFVVITGRTDDTYDINDPWYGDSETTLNDRYGNPATAIKSMKIYHGTPPTEPTTQSQWEFNQHNNTENWAMINIYDMVNIGDYSVHDGVFYINPYISDPQILSPLLALDSKNYDTVSIRMASNCNDAVGVVYFSTSNSAGYSDTKKVEFTVINDGNYHVYNVLMGSNSYWTGTITGLRIDPANYGDSEGEVDTVGFDYIRLTKTSPPSGRVTINLDTKYWEETLSWPGGKYQLRIIAEASPGDVSSITISGPCIDAVTYSYSGGQRCFILDTKEPPRIGQTITFYIEYQDNSSETISKTIDGVFTETPVLVSPPDGSTVNTLTPTFEWRNLSISGLIYSVQIDDINHTTRVYSVYDLPDETTSHTIPGGYLDRGTTYYWLVAATDANGNEALAYFDKFRVSSVAGLGYSEVTQVTDTINQGIEAIFNYIISQTKDLIFALGWEGSTLKLSAYRPDGSLYAEEESSTSPISISVPKAEAGEWRYKITGIDVPYDDYPFVAEIGERPPVASDLQNLIVYPNPCRLTDGNPTITFKGLTVDATIRIVGIDGQLVNQTELIGQVNWTWNVKNQTDEGLSRGIYIYLITNTAGEKKVGKIAIIK